MNIYNVMNLCISFKSITNEKMYDLKPVLGHDQDQLVLCWSNTKNGT